MDPKAKGKIVTMILSTVLNSVSQKYMSIRISECDLIWKKDHEMRWALNPKTRVLRRRGDDTHRFEEKAV